MLVSEAAEDTDNTSSEDTGAYVTLPAPTSFVLNKSSISVTVNSYAPSITASEALRLPNASSVGDPSANLVYACPLISTLCILVGLSWSAICIT